ncbi:MAG: ATPase, T2SS/T4P/T4SS family, partial [Candidatus Diapherotrites archaeon]
MEQVMHGNGEKGGGERKRKRKFSDEAEIEKILGWRVFELGEEAGKVLRKGKGHTVVGNRAGERVYCLTDFPNLTRHEALVIRKVMDEFRERQERGTSGNVSAVLEGHCRREGLKLDDDQHAYLSGVLKYLIYDFGVLAELLADDGIEEIAVIGLGKEKPVHVYDRIFGWMKTNIYFSNEEVVRNIVNKMGRKIGRRLAMQTPRINAVLPDGSRLNACVEPVSFSGPCVTIRKFRQRPFTPPELSANGTISAEAIAFLWMAMQCDISLLICGNTGSGKTSTMNALFSFIPRAERIIITEETPEINLPHSHVVKLNTVEQLGVGMDTLITDSLRMRPDRVIVGEIRNAEEVSAFINTILAGQGRGSYATFHAQSAKECVARMRKLGVMEIDLSAVDIVLVQRRWNRAVKGGQRMEEIRRVVEVAEVSAGRAERGGKSGAGIAGGGNAGAELKML